MNFALIKDGMVTNVIVADQKFIDAHLATLNCDQALDVTGEYVGPGFSYADGLFTPPPSPPDDGSVP